MTFEEIFKSHPAPTSLDRDTLLRCIRECCDCSASCTACADACLGENDLRVFVRCIRLNLDCADACDATTRTVARQTAADLGLIRTTLKACAAACRACGDECDVMPSTTSTVASAPRSVAAASGHAAKFSH